MSNYFKLRPTHFSSGAKIFLRGFSPPCAPWLQAYLGLSNENQFIQTKHHPSQNQRT